MPETSEFAAAAGLPAASLADISQKLVLVKSSNVYNQVVRGIVQKWNDMKKLQSEGRRLRKQRVYVPYSVTATARYRLKAAFPQYEILFVTASRISAAYQRAVSLLVSEFMVALTEKAGRRVLLLGYQMRPALLRDRSWVVPYIPSADPRFQTAWMAEDREIQKIYNGMARSTKRVPNTLFSYIKSVDSVLRSDVLQDETQANVTCVMLDHIDTNFRQLATWMHIHGNRLLFFSIPGCKAMEYGVDGYFDELDAYVTHTQEGISLVFPGDMDFQRTYNRNNYLELIARTKLVLYGKTFVKEFVGSNLGYLTYKITATSGELQGEPPVYRSWMNPGYKHRYMVDVPVLKPGGRVDIKADWQLVGVEVDRRIVDDVIAMALGNTDGKMDEVIARKINSKAHQAISAGQVTRRAVPLTTEQFEAALVSIYCDAFSRKFEASVTTSTFAPLARNSGRATGGLLPAVRNAGALVGQYFDWYTVNQVKRGLSSYVSLFEKEDVPLPQIRSAVGYFEYSDKPEDIVGFSGWNNSDPFDGFSPFLPHYPASSSMAGYRKFLAPVPVETGTNEIVSTGTIHDPFDPWDWVVDDNDVTGVEASPSWFAKVSKGIAGYFGRQTLDPSRLTEAELAAFAAQEHWMSEPHEPDVYEVVAESSLRVMVIDSDPDPAAFDEVADVIVERVYSDHPTSQVPTQLMSHHAFLAPEVRFELVPGTRSDNPLSDAREVIGDVFPQAQIMDPKFTEAERMYGDATVLMRAIGVKIDMSRMEPLKPEGFFLPAMITHVQPPIKETTKTVLQTIAKRNANTPFVRNPVDEAETLDRMWRAQLKAFYVPNADVMLQRLGSIQLDELALREWLAKLDPARLKKLMDQDSFAWDEVANSTEYMNLMLKSKLKPNMDVNYAQAIQLPQSVQYDATGRSVLLLSPMIRHKVKREQLLLKPNVLVMQRKSRDDVVRFLNMFDWRRNSRGPRSYIEIDQSLFDKSQVTATHKMYLHILKKFGVEQDVLDFIDQHMNRRKVSSQKGGVQVTLEGQNASGVAYTLDRNNEVSKTAVAELLEEIRAQVEFVLIMGDDVTIAIRGDVDVSGWEQRMSALHNLSPKIRIQSHGYFCSYDIVHLPDGRTTIVRDVVKALLALSDLGIKDIDNLHERWISFVDSTRDIDDLRVQVYLRDALYQRWRVTHPTVTPTTFATAVRVIAALRNEYELFRQFFSDQRTMRYY